MSRPHSLGQWSPNFLAPVTGFLEDNSDGFGVIHVHYMYCALYFYYVLTIMWNQWEPGACFLATRWSHLWVMGDSERSSGIRVSRSAQPRSLTLDINTIVHKIWVFVTWTTGLFLNGEDTIQAPLAIPTCFFQATANLWAILLLLKGFGPGDV